MSAFSNRQSIKDMNDQINDASSGDTILASIDEEIASLSSSNVGKGQAFLDKALEDSEDNVKAMKRRALGARNTLTKTIKPDPVFDSNASLARDWLTASKADEEAESEGIIQALSDKIATQSAALLTAESSMDENFLRTGRLDNVSTLTQDPDSIRTDAERIEDSQYLSGSGVGIEDRIFAPEPTETNGLMSRPDNVDAVEAYTAEVAKADKDFNTAFVKKMADSEGIVDHVDSLGIPTLGYGILPETARNYGFDPDSAEYSDRKVLAAAVYNAMYKEAKTSYSDVFKNLDESQKVGVLSLYINLGELPDGVVTALSSATPDFDAARESLSSVVLGSPRDAAGKRKKDSKNNTIYTSSKGLSKRRAGEYNMLMKGQSGFEPITTVSVEGTKAAPEFVWKDKNDIEIHRYTPTVTGQGKVYQGLDDSNSMTTVDV